MSNDICAALTDDELAAAALDALAHYPYASELPYFLASDSPEYAPFMVAIRAAIATALPQAGEGEGPSDEELTQFLFDNFRGPIAFICDAEEEAHIMIRNHIKFARAVLARWGCATPPAPEPGSSLSPAAQAVLEAVIEAPHCGSGRIKAAAALRAVADQVVPEPPDCGPGFHGYNIGAEDRQRLIRFRLLAIADELEGQS